MRLSIWRSKGNGTFEAEEVEYDQPDFRGFKMPMAHCDQSILHAPGACQYCDHYPEAQALRQWWGINFTGQHDPDKAPCPSTHRRTDEVRDLWGGNVAVPRQIHPPHERESHA